MDEKTYELIIDENYSLPLLETEAIELKKLQRSFINSYYENGGCNDIGKWLTDTLQSHLPEKNDEEIQGISKEIIETLKTNESNKKSLESAVANGRSKESWFGATMQNAVAHMGMNETVSYMTNLDKALEMANLDLYDTILTSSGNINMNPNLDGYIAEQYHVNSFNLEAELKGSEYRAKVLKPNGKGYNKNSVDIVIVDGNGKTVKRYQSKYCKDTNKTEDSFKKGDYRGQQKLTPEDQNVKKSTTQIESPDGIKSKPLSKSKVKELQNEAQSGNWNELNWNEYKTKDLAIGIGKKASIAGLQGAAIGIGYNIASKLWKKEEVKGDEIIGTALKSSADIGIKAASAGALKVGVEKGIIKAIPKGTPAGTIANIAYVGIENVKIIGKVATGELTVKEGLCKMEETTVATVAGIAAGAKGSVLGAAIGTVFGPVGTAVGGFIGGSVAYLAGSKVGEVVVKTAQRIREKAVEVVKTLVSKAVDKIKNTVNNFTNVVSSIFGW